MKIKQTSLLTSLLLASLTLTYCGKVSEVTDVLNSNNDVVKTLTLNTQASVESVPSSVAIPIPDSMKTIPSMDKIVSEPDSQAVRNYNEKKRNGYEGLQVSFGSSATTSANIVSTVYNVVSAAINSIDDLVSNDLQEETEVDRQRGRAKGLDRVSEIDDEVDFINKFVQVELTLLDPIITDLNQEIGKDGQNVIARKAKVFNVKVSPTAIRNLISKLQKQNLNVDYRDIPKVYRNPALCYKTKQPLPYEFSITFSYDESASNNNLCADDAATSLIGATISWNSDKTKIFASRSITTRAANPLFNGALFDTTRTVSLYYQLGNLQTEKVSIQTRHKPVKSTLIVGDLLDETINIKLETCLENRAQDHCVEAYVETLSRDVTPEMLRTPAAIQGLRTGNMDMVAPVEEHIITGKADDEGGFTQDVEIKGNQRSISQESFNEDALPTEVMMGTATVAVVNNVEEVPMVVIQRALASLAPIEDLTPPLIVPEILRRGATRDDVELDATGLPKNKYTQSFIDTIKRPTVTDDNPEDDVPVIRSGRRSFILPPSITKGVDEFTVFRPIKKDFQDEEEQKRLRAANVAAEAEARAAAEAEDRAAAEQQRIVLERIAAEERESLESAKAAIRAANAAAEARAAEARAAAEEEERRKTKVRREAQSEEEAYQRELAEIAKERPRLFVPPKNAPTIPSFVKGIAPKRIAPVVKHDVDDAEVGFFRPRRLSIEQAEQ